MATVAAHTETGDIWQSVQALLKERMSQPSFETWIGPLQLVSCGEKRVMLVAESAFNRDWVLKNYKNELREAFTQVLGQAPDVQVSVAEEPKPESSEVPQLHQPEKSNRPWTPRTTVSNLNPKYTFENFVIGQHNRFCHAAALAVAEAPAQSYNPFFIYGGVGLGKTHLMQAIGHFVLAHHQEHKVRYVTAEQFTNDLISALGNKDMKPFRERYRRIDVLIIDDIQFLEGKERTQEEIFHTFNTLHEAGKQIILSSDRPPRNLSRLEDRLRSRFEWGLIADIQPADVETRLAILRKKATRDGLNVPDDVLTYLAEAHPNNIRELEGALNKVAAYGMLTRSPLDLPSVQNLLGIRLDANRLSQDQILETVAQYYHLRPVDLKSPSRAKDVSHARQVAIYIIRTLTEASFPKIGEALGGRKHTTILYAYEKIREEMDQHPVLSRQIEEITQRVKRLT
jgi:chromosomal replication initiator protein